MPVVTLALTAALLLTDLVARAVVHRHHFGENPLRWPAGAFHWCVGVIRGGAILVTGVAAPLAELVGPRLAAELSGLNPVPELVGFHSLAELAALHPVPALDEPALQIAGAALAGANIVVIFVCQHAMGPSFRLTIDPGENHPALVTGGPFGLVRNPVYAALTTLTAALALTLPNLLALAGATAMLIGNELQVRCIEEPYLTRIHGTAYQEYAARTGRFLPRLGRLR
ncbi:isoprenylcysteine carboxylmethyltransferase family protein [Streptomyces nondiastaticus]|uniref:methyltransferase family protein n=1 Tax=Streptomyces nondiastaticus TaxID=3154512 RepID=UPI003436725F